MRMAIPPRTLRRLAAIQRASRLGLAALSLMFPGGITACGSDGAGPEGGIAGRYALRLVNRVALPMSETYSWGIDSFTAGSLTVHEDGTWSLEIRGGTSFGLDGGFPAPWTVTDFGEFESEGGNLAFNSGSTGLRFSGSWDGSAVAIVYDWDPHLSADRATEFVFER
jgi:hypothetical protein